MKLQGKQLSKEEQLIWNVVKTKVIYDNGRLNFTGCRKIAEMAGVKGIVDKITWTDTDGRLLGKGIGANINGEIIEWDNQEYYPLESAEPKFDFEYENS